VGTIYEWRIAESTRRANALVTGIGSADIATDTLISALSEDEVDAIVAHELGHCALHHVRARLLLQSLIFVGIFYATVLQCITARHFCDGNGSWNELRWFLAFSFIGVALTFTAISLWRCLSKAERAADLFSWTLMAAQGRSLLRCAN